MRENGYLFEMAEEDILSKEYEYAEYTEGHTVDYLEYRGRNDFNIYTNLHMNSIMIHYYNMIKSAMKRMGKWDLERRLWLRLLFANTTCIYMKKEVGDKTINYRLPCFPCYPVSSGKMIYYTILLPEDDNMREIIDRLHYIGCDISFENHGIHNEVYSTSNKDHIYVSKRVCNLILVTILSVIPLLLDNIIFEDLEEEVRQEYSRKDLYIKLIKYINIYIRTFTNPRQVPVLLYDVLDLLINVKSTSIFGDLLNLNSLNYMLPPYEHMGYNIIITPDSKREKESKNIDQNDL